MSSNSSGKKLEGFFTGKGFYIVLFLCAAVIGVSAWIMAAGNKTMAENTKDVNSVRLENKRVETVIVPPAETAAVLQEKPEEIAPPVSDEGLNQPSDAAEVESETSQVWREGDVLEVAAPLYAWPVEGEISRAHDMDALSYDSTMKDWRTHSGVDILAPVGTAVTAAHAGSVESIANDDLLGTVVTVDHGDGSRSVYANLAPELSVSVGDWVEPGTAIGAVGETALCEVGQEPHLHFSIAVDGVSVNPLNYLPA